MKDLERVEFVIKHLNQLYPHPPIPLDHKDPYTLLIAVLLSANATDKGVNKVTAVLFPKADTPQKMVKLKVTEIEKIIRPNGLSPQKSKNIHALSQILLDLYDGKVPQTFEELEALPGVGHKTASVVMSQAFGFPAFPVDTHIHRLAQRWGFSSGQNVKVTEEKLKKLFPQKTWNKLHLQMIYYAREFCQARACYGLECTICTTLYPRRKTQVITKK